MTDAQNTKGLFFLGRRVERLLLFGLLLTVFSVIEGFLATASSRFAADRQSEILGELLRRVQSQSTELDRLWDLSQQESVRRKEAERANEAARSRQIQEEKDAAEEARRRQAVAGEDAEVRRKLGLPPISATPRKRPRAVPVPIPGLPSFTYFSEQYSKSLREIVADVAKATNARTGDVEGLVDLSKSPKLILDTLRTQVDAAEKKRANVLGIESPKLLPIQYAGLDYKVPSNVLALAGLVALGLLAIGWLGSLYVTRQRELLLISRLDDFKLAFPHILNLLPVSLDTYLSRIGIQPPPRARNSNRKLARISLYLFRAIIISAFALTIGGFFTYSAFYLLMSGETGEPILFGIALIVPLIMLLQLIGLLLFEGFVLKGKEFFE